MNNPKNTRMCMSCKKRAPKENLIRITMKDNEYVTDNENKVDNRGIYICRSKECIEKLEKRKNIDILLKNSFKGRTIQKNHDKFLNLLDEIKRG